MAKHIYDLGSLNQKVEEKASEYTTYEPIRVFCGTFNVNGKHPDEDLRSWLFVNEKNIDLYAIGLQEVVDLNTTSFLLQTDWAEREKNWINCIDYELCTNSFNGHSNNNNNRTIFGKEKKPKYKLTAKIRMFGLLLLIYSHKRTNITEVLNSSVPTGDCRTFRCIKK